MSLGRSLGQAGVLACAVLVIAAGSGHAHRSAIELQGPMIQGGLIVGRVAPGTSIAVAGKPVRVSPAGEFVFGFGRDAPRRVRLDAVFADGRSERRTLTVRQRHYKVQRIAGLAPRKVTPRPEDLKRIGAEAELIRAARRHDTDMAWFRGGFAWPAQGPISGVFGSRRILNGEPRRPHLGVDVAAPAGAPVVAAADGVVALARADMFYTGNTVMIDHGHGLTSVYAHLSKLLVAPGRKVAKGTRIGLIGATGRVTGPHLHWGVTLFRTQLDPALLVGPMPPAKDKAKDKAKKGTTAR